MREVIDIRQWGAMLTVFLTLLSIYPGAHAAASAGAETAMVFETMDGQTTDAFEGKIWVPENRGNSGSRLIPIHYVRFPATTAEPGPPIIYLAGGPGGSGIMTAKYPNFRFPLFMALREHGDVIALDQRGTGASSSLPECVSPISVPLDQLVTDREVSNLTRVAALECVAFWEDQGIDVAGYNSLESARDIDDLRQHLGADSVTLWGISYGSHLALASLKVMEKHIHKMVIASAEGLDQTVKLPSRTDAYFRRLQLAINTQPDAATLYPDIMGMMQRVHKQLEKAPVQLQIPGEDGQSTGFLFQRFHMQALAAGMIADPQRGVAPLLSIYRGIDTAALDEATRQALIAIVQRAGLADNAISFRLMPLAMDVASGISAVRQQQVEREAASSLLGLALNFPMPQLANSIEGVDLGDAFRLAPSSPVPTLLITGTLDGRTYIKGQKEATQGLSNLTQVTVVNAGHNLFMSSPKVTAAIHSFLRDEELAEKEILIPLPLFAP